MARKTKFNSLDRQAYQLGRQIERKELFPEFSVSVSPTALRSRGVTDEEIAYILECPVEDVAAVIDYDIHTAKVISSSDKDVVKELVVVDKFLTELGVTIGVLEGNKKTQRGKKK